VTNQKWWFWGLKVVIPVWLFIGVMRFLGWLEPVELMALDAMFQWRTPLSQEVDSRIVIVGVTESDIGQLDHYPLSDRVLAQLLNKILAAEPVVVGLDLFRDVPVNYGDKGEGTKALEHIFRTSDNLIGVGKFTSVPGDEFFSQIAPPQLLAQKQQVADISTIVDPDGVVRRGNLYPIADGSPESKIPSLALKVAYVYLSRLGINPKATERGWLRLGKAVFPPFEKNNGGYINADDRGYQILIDWRGLPYESFLHVSVMDVLGGKIPPERLRGKIVLIGAYAPSLKDSFYTPYSKYRGSSTPKPTFGVEIQGVLTRQIIDAALGEGSLIRYIAEPLEYFWLLVWISLELIWIVLWRRRWHYSWFVLFIALIGGIGLSGVLVAVTYTAFSVANLWIPSSAVTLGIVLMAVWATLYFYIEDLNNYNRTLVDKVNEKTQHLQEALIKLQATQEHLVIREKLTAISSLVGSLSHELKNPLWAVGNRLEIMTHLTQQLRPKVAGVLLESDKDKQREMLEPFLQKWEQNLGKAEQELARANGLVVTLLPVPQGQLPQSLANATFGMVVDLALKLACQREMGQDIHIETQLGKFAKVPVKIPLVLLRILTNLLDNACYAVLQKQQGLNADYVPQIQIELVEENDSVIWRIWDNGVGISESVQKRLFEPLVTTKPASEGSGLGLYIVYELLEKHQAVIEVKSQVREYTEFEILFPKSQLLFDVDDKLTRI
jgi:CHASE2 domain-containing sensor protein/two-component sensor histidine kinase